MIDRDDRANLERSTPRATIRVSVLGPVTASVDGAERRLQAGRERALLACLALHGGEAVSADRLLDEIWGDQLPETGARALAYQIAKLRSTLEPARVGQGTLISTSDAGYRLHIAPDDVDVNRFDNLIDEARAAVTSDPAHSETLLVEAMALWRAHPFADLDDEPFVERETRRLGQRRVLARHTLAEARIAFGRSTEVVGELEVLVEDHPLEEALVALLMTALHRSGRTADALRTYGELRRRLSAELGIQPSGELQQLERELLADGEPAPTPQPQPRAVPVATSSFVGRADELASIRAWVISARLVSLCGFGGLGKTRLAQEIARTIGDGFADGVWYVDLASIDDPEMLPDTIARAGGLSVQRNRDPVDLVVALLAGREVLIVLDNCDRLGEELAELVPKLVRAGPDVRVVTTCRRSLGLPDEAVWTVRPLDAAAAIELFIDRAGLARPGWVIDDANRPAVHDVCRRLDGIPLAIEMAAARLAVMNLTQIVEHLDNRFRLLTAPDREIHPRQESLATVMDWSYDLLDRADQVLLRRMSVCAGGFDLDAATTIGTPGASTLADVLDRLGHLVEATLVVFDASRDSPRYRMLETVRHYVSGKLDDEERADAGLAHATHYEAVAARAFELWNTDYDAARRLGDREMDNLRAAMRWAYGHGRPRLGLSIAHNSRIHFFTQLADRELVRWLRAGLELVVDDDPLTLEAAAALVLHAHNADDLDAQCVAADRVERAIDQVDDPRLRAELLNAMAASFDATDPRTAVAYQNAAIELRASTPLRMLAFLNNRVEQSWDTGELADGEAILRMLEELREAMPTRNPVRYKVEAGVAARAGRWAEVVGIAETACDLDPVMGAAVGLFLAEGLGALGRFDEALLTLTALDRDGLGYYARFADLVHASTDLRRYEPRAAADRLTAMAGEIARDGRRLAVGMQAAALLAVAAHDLGQHESAAVLLGHAAAEQRRLDIVLRPSDRPLVEEAIEGCRTILGPNRFDQLAARGAASEWADLPTVELDELAI